MGSPAIAVSAHSATGLIAPTQAPNMESTAMSLTIPSESVTASQVQGAPEPQGPLSTAVHIPSTAIDINFNASISLSAFKYTGSHITPTSAKLTKHPMDANASQSYVFHPAMMNDFATVDAVAESAISGIANPESQNIFTSGPTLSTDSALTLGSDTSITVLAPQTSITQPLNASDFLLSLATTMDYLSKDPPFLTTNARTVTADSLGRYSIGSQLLTKSAVTTVSRKMISLASNKSAVVVGTSTEAFGPSATARFGSGSNGTEVQRFSGNALGARDGLWGSSMMFLVFFMVLLWL